MLQVVAATVLFAVPIRFFGLKLPEPVFMMAPTFAWAMIRPSFLAPFGVLLMGLFLDVFWGGPIGLWGLSLLVAYGIVLLARNMLAGQSKPMMWAWYVAASGIAMVSAVLFTRLDVHASPSWIAVGWQLLATAILYPFADRLIDRFEDADVRFR